MPLQPLDDGPDPEVRPLGQVGLADDDRARGLQLRRDERVSGHALGECEGAACRRHAGGVDVVLDDDRNPEQWTAIAVASRLVGRSCVFAGRRADRDHRMELLVELVDALDVEVRQLDGAQLARVHQLLKLRNRGRVDVDTANLGRRLTGREADQRRGAGYAEQEGQQGRQDNGTPKSAAHRVTSTGSGGTDAGITGPRPAIWRLDSIPVPLSSQRFDSRTAVRNRLRCAGSGVSGVPGTGISAGAERLSKTVTRSAGPDRACARFVSDQARRRAGLGVTSAHACRSARRGPSLQLLGESVGVRPKKRHEGDEVVARAFCSHARDTTQRETRRSPLSRAPSSAPQKTWSTRHSSACSHRTPRSKLLPKAKRRLADQRGYGGNDGRGTAICRHRDAGRSDRASRRTVHARPVGAGRPPFRSE